MSKLFEKGILALGIVIGGCSTLLFVLFWPECESGDTTLWFCDENTETVLGVLTLLQQVVAAIAWPVAVVFLSLIFHRDLSILFSKVKLKAFKALGFEAEFVGVLDNLEEEIKSNAVALDIRDKPPSENILRSIQVDKKFAVFNAWLEVEQQLIEMLEKRASVITLQQGKSLSFRMSELRRLELPTPIERAISDLRAARNSIAHIPEFELDEAQIRRYLDLAADISDYLSRRIEGNI